MSYEHPGDLFADLDGRPRLLSPQSPKPSLTRAVVDEVLNPVRMLADDGTPEETFVSTSTTIPLIRDSLVDTREKNGMLPNLTYSQLGPVRNLHVLWGFSLELHRLRVLEQLLDEAEGAVVFLRQEEALKSS